MILKFLELILNPNIKPPSLTSRLYKRSLSFYHCLIFNLQSHALFVYFRKRGMSRRSRGVSTKGSHKRQQKKAKRSSAPPATRSQELKPGDRLVVETVSTRSHADVLWQVSNEALELGVLLGEVTSAF